MQDASGWFIEETKTANFGDNRLNKRYENILSSFASSPNKSIPGTFKSWNETIATYRFLNHENISDQDIIAPHKEATLKRIQNEQIVLIIQDTTEIDFSGRKPMTGMGYLSKEHTQGFYLHPSIAITPDRCCLGIVDMQTWIREDFGVTQGNDRKRKPIQEKESYCWLKGYEAANAIALSSPKTKVVNVADRASDIYEVLEKTPSELNKAYWLIRAQHNRRILADEGDNKLQKKLWDAARNAKSIGEIEFNLPKGKIYNRDASRRGARQERVVRQEIRVCTVSLCPPRNKANRRPTAINLIYCCEINAPSEEDKIEWLLLTSYPINNAESAIQIVGWYLCRWQIEIFFKILKSGCVVEELQFDTFRAITNCIAVYSIVAWRILYLTMMGRHCPDLDCNAVFEDEEWHSVYAVVTKKPPPKSPPKLNEIILMIAKLGGFLGRKSDGYPGPKVIWIGMQRMKDFAIAWKTFHSFKLN